MEWSPPGMLWVENPHWIYRLSTEEIEQATKTAIESLTQGYKPIAKTATPECIVTLGAPGAGKTSTAMAFVKRYGKHPGDTYIDFDIDAIIRYHPRYANMWRLRDVDGNPINVGLTDAWNNGMKVFNSIASKVALALFSGRYNFIIHTCLVHSALYDAKRERYRVVLLLVAAPLAVCQARARRRAVTTGKFLSYNLHMQDEGIEGIWRHHRAASWWYSLLCDEFFIVDNGEKEAAPDSVVAKAVRVPVHSAEMGQTLNAKALAIQKIIDTAVKWDEGPKTRKP